MKEEGNMTKKAKVLPKEPVLELATPTQPETIPEPETPPTRPTNRPSKEDLKKGMKAALDTLDNPEPETTPEPEPEPTPEPTPEPETPSLRKKYLASSKEAIILHHKNKKVNEAIDKAIETPEPTDEDLQAAYADWEVMNDFEKKMAKDSLWNNRRFAALEEIRKENKDYEGWQDKVEQFVADPANLAQYPELEGKEDDFRLFASKPTRRNIEFEVLVGAFLHDASKTVPVKPKPAAMFDTGSAGTPGKPKPPDKKLSPDEAARLRLSNYKEFKRLLKTGRIDPTAVE